MTIPFLKYFQRKKAEPVKETPPPPPLEKPSSERLSKTVMPNSVRNLAPEPAIPAARAVAPPPPIPVAAPVAGGRAMPVSAVPPAARTVAAPAPGRRADLPPAVAFALEPKVERVISLALRDVIAQLPAGVVRPLKDDEQDRRVLLKAADVEKGMASGRPTVPVTSIHQQVPEIFLKAITPSDPMQVTLPATKVIAELSKLHVRGDQMRESAVPQVETPFLTVTLEDNERFGTSITQVETGPMPRVKVEPPTAKAFADAQPEALPQRTPAPEPVSPPRSKIPFSLSSTPAASAATPAAAPKSEPPPAAPTRIPFKLSPNGTDAPATESVPASGGSSVPSPSPAPLPAPTRIPFTKVTAPSDELRGKKQEDWITAESLGVKPKSEALAKRATAEEKVRLPLEAVLESLPEFQRNGDASSVPADVCLELPFSAVESQLPAGRVTVSPEQFAAAIPEPFRGVFKADCACEVVLPLQQVLKNLPGAALKMREHQIEQEIGGNFDTPFSATAAEDAKRFNIVSAPIAKPTAVIAEAQPQQKATDETPDIDSSTPQAETAKTNSDSARTPLQVALDTDEKLDAKGVIAHLNRMPGVKASAILFTDGLSLAGDLPKELQTDGICAMAPSLMQRIENHLVDTKLGTLRSMTLACTKGTITFFAHETVCVAALHATGEIAPDVRERFGRVVHELSRKYSHPV